jgi:hypothetical protein
LWPRTADGELAMYTRPLDLHKLLSELKEKLPMPPGPKDL